MVMNTSTTMEIRAVTTEVTATLSRMPRRKRTSATTIIKTGAAILMGGVERNTNTSMTTAAMITTSTAAAVIAMATNIHMKCMGKITTMRDAGTVTDTSIHTKRIPMTMITVTTMDTRRVFMIRRTRRNSTGAQIYREYALRSRKR
jgi:hypothetical protein